MPTPRPVLLRVPASTSNLGPGFDAFGVALDLDLRVRWEPGERNAVERTGGLAESPLSVGRDPVMRGMRRAAMLSGRHVPPGRLTVHAPFPPGRGLGASGAGLVAGLVLGDRLTGGKLGAERLLEEAVSLEGNPENAVAALRGGAHWSVPVGDGHRHLPVSLHRELRFLLVIPPYAMETRRSRDALPTSVAFARAVRQAQRPPALLEGLRTLDEELIRAGMEDELHVDARVRLLTGARAMMDFAREAGAIAATLSGAGSALLVVTRTGSLRATQTRLEKRVQRLWGDSGAVLAARVQNRGAQFLRRR